MSASPATPDELILDYAAGSCSPAMSLLMATHLSMSENSRQSYSMLKAAAGALFMEAVENRPMHRVSAQSVLEAAEEMAADDAPDHDENLADGVADGAVLQIAKFAGDRPPLPLRPYVADFGDDDAWQRLGRSVAAARLSASDDQERAHLLWAKPGVQIATHRHIGREVVLVLEGAFWDDDVRYGPGDIAVGEDGTVHAPWIDDGDACLCLAVTEAPVQFVGAFGWMLNRFCRF